MITRIFTYPGDPPTEVRLMFGEEFLQRHPNRNITISGCDGADPTVIPVDEVICDTCNALIDEAEPCAETDYQLQCWSCYQEWVKPHLQNERT